MRELLYLSDQKLHRVWMEASNAWAGGRWRWSAAAKVPPFASIDVSREPGGGEEVAVSRKLERVIGYLGDVEDDITAAEVRPHQWVRFDLSLGYGTACRDDQCRGHTSENSPRHTSPDDVALFVGTVGADVTGQTRDLDVLLCGSVHHLRDRVSSLDRLGSDTDWMHAIITKLYEREQRGLIAIPTQLTELVPRTGTAGPEQQAHFVHGVAANNHPKSQRGRLCGYARVLMNIDNPEFPTRLIMATPLYVEVPPPAAALGRKRWWRRS
ncbi:MAG: SAVMC3_10250 family protein [Stackebrandtia sp.]